MKKVIDNFKTSGGKHCITTALKQVFDYYECTLTESMIFGIGSGLSFMYLNLADAPMISGRIKPFEFEKILADRLQLKMKCKGSKEYRIVFQKTKKMLDANKPVLIYADMPYLDYLNLGEESHFGGHAVVIFGYDDEEEIFYISDRDNSDIPIRTPKGEIAKDYHKVTYKNVELARSSKHRPFPAKNKYVEVDFENFNFPTRDTIYSAIKETCENMINPGAKLLGLNGIKKFSKEILKWEKFDEKKLKSSGIANYFMISAHGGTGGGIFRNMYGEFLLESAKMLDSKELRKSGEKFLVVSQKWDRVAELLWNLSESGSLELLMKTSELIKEIYIDEKDLYESLNDIVS